MFFELNEVKDQYILHWCLLMCPFWKSNINGQIYNDISTKKNKYVLVLILKLCFSKQI